MDVLERVRSAAEETVETADHFRRVVLERLTERWSPDKTQALLGHGVSTDDLVDDTVDAILAVLPVRVDNEMADLIGSFHDTAGVCRRLNISKQAVDDARQRRTLLGMRTSDGTWVYPTFQFDGAVRRSDLKATLHALRSVDPWLVASWLCAPDDDLGGQSPQEWLRDGGPGDLVLELAGDVSRRWG